MTEAIDEQFEQQDKLQHMQVIRDFGGDHTKEDKPIHNQYPEDKTKLDQDTFFNVPAKPADFTLGATTRDNDSLNKSLN